MHGKRFLKTPLQFVHPLSALDFVLEGDHGARIGSRASGSPETKIVVQVVSEKGAALGEVLILKFELLAEAIDRPAMNLVKFLLVSHVHGQVRFLAPLRTKNLDDATIVLTVFAWT